MLIQNVLRKYINKYTFDLLNFKTMFGRISKLNEKSVW